MLSEHYLGQVRARWTAVADLVFEVAADGDGRPKVLGREGGRHVELRVTRDNEPASEPDILFIGHAFWDIPRLLELAESGGELPSEEAALIGTRIASARPGPWSAFIESDGGTGGSDVIRISEIDSEVDMYLWIDAKLAPAAVFRFVAEARQDVAALLAATRD